MKAFKYLMTAMGGVVVGASVALLMAPADGRNTRKRLSKRLDRNKKVLSRELGRHRDVLVKKGRAALDEATEYVTDELNGARKKIVQMVGL